ncbi:MAG: hypothetical protein ACI9BV_003665 [Rhodothermales bacterium]|jgi:hypothetical protein
MMSDPVKQYLSTIGRKGGKKSRRELDPKMARDMVRVREARKAFRRFHARCFWSSPPSLHIGLGDVDWVCDGLKRRGDREAWDTAARLCR